MSDFLNKTPMNICSLLYISEKHFSATEKKRNNSELKQTKTMWHILFCSVHISVNLCHIQRLPSTTGNYVHNPLLVCPMLLLDLSVVEAWEGGKNSVFVILKNCLSQKNVLIQISVSSFCVCLCMCAHVRRLT